MQPAGEYGGSCIMKIFLKTIVWAIILIIGLLAGIYLLDGYVVWRTVVFCSICLAAGSCAHKLFQWIDNKAE